jgi:ABC-type dipeptide/oligopeptide/nickel transport system ATPase component
VPAADALPPGCRFAPRCSYALASCDVAVPTLVAAGRDRLTACIRHDDGVPAP